MLRKLIALALVILLMFAEYRVIMRNIQPFYGEDGCLYLEVSGQVDAYCVEDDERMHEIERLAELRDNYQRAYDHYMELAHASMEHIEEIDQQLEELCEGE